VQTPREPSLLLLDSQIDSVIVNMAAPQVQHQGLQAFFTGVRRDFDGVIVDQFRGIKYAQIPARFQRAQPVETFNGGVVDATKYGYVLSLSSMKPFSLPMDIQFDILNLMLKKDQNVHRFRWTCVICCASRRILR
jgi:hypothetical protein